MSTHNPHRWRATESYDGQRRCIECGCWSHSRAAGEGCPGRCDATHPITGRRCHHGMTHAAYGHSYIVEVDRTQQGPFDRGTRWWWYADGRMRDGCWHCHDTAVDADGKPCRCTGGQAVLPW